MKVRTVLFLIAIAMTASAALAQSDAPFSIQLPPGFGEFAKSTHNAQSIETTSWLSKGAGNAAVVVTVSKFPKKINTPVKLLDSTRDGLLKSTNATLDSDDTVSTNPPTRRLVMHSSAAWVRAKLIAKSDMLYQVIFIGRSADAPNAGPVSQMFDGFQIK
jgi:hypothetical protein